MLRWLLLAVLLVLAPAAFAQEACNDNAHAEWTVITDAEPWGGCTPSGDDTFTIDSHVVTMDGNVTVTTGKVIVDGGTLILSPEFLFEPGDQAFELRSGRLIAAGKSVECRIVDEPSYGASGVVTLVTNCDTSWMVNNADPALSHWVVIGDDDPGLGPITGSAVQIGAGLATGSQRGHVHRPSPAKWRWFKTNANGSGRTITINTSPFTFATNGSCTAANVPWPCCTGLGTGACVAPYTGSVDPPNTAIPAYTATLSEDGMSTVLSWASSAHVAVDGDWGSGYVYWPETTTSDPDDCSGMQAKILKAEDNTAGNDLLLVAGDVTRCPGTAGAVARITHGIRRGDKIYLVDPVVIDGDRNGDDGPDTAGMRLSGGQINLDWTLILRMGVRSGGSDNPVLGGAYVVGLIEDSKGVLPTGTITNTAIILPDASETTDTQILGFEMTNSGQTGFRFPGAPATSGGPRISKVYIADTVYDDSGQGNGGHGIWMNGGNWELDRVRVERTSDDGIGAAGINDNTGFTFSSRMKVERFLAYETIAASDNSQQPINPTAVEADGAGCFTPAGGGCWQPAGWADYRDGMAFGSFSDAIQGTGWGIWLDGVLGGNSAATAASTINLGIISEIAATHPNQLEANTCFVRPNIYRNGWITPSAVTTSGTSQISLDGWIVNSIMSGNGTFALSAWNLFNPCRVDGFFWVEDGPGTANHFWRGDAGADGTGQGEGWSNRFEAVDTAFVRPNAAGSLIWFDGTTTDEELMTGGHLLNRVVLAQNSTWTSGSCADIFCLTMGGPAVIDGFVGQFTAASVAPTFNRIDTTPRNVFVTGSGTSTSIFGAGNETLNFQMLGGVVPQAGQTFRLRDFVSKNTGHPWDNALPRKLGWQQWYTSHALLGDFVVEQHYKYSDKDLIVPVGMGGSGVGGGLLQPRAF